MPAVTTEGIILSRKISGDSDFICSVYTKDYGKQHIIFKGLQKSRKRPISASEPGSVINLSYNLKENSSIHTVSSFEPVLSTPGIRNSTPRIFSLYYMMELVDRTSVHGDSGEKIFNLTAAAIKVLETTEHIIHFDLFFTLHYMALLGILPETGRCSYCGTETSASWEVENLTLRFICSNCSDYHLQDISGITSMFIKGALTAKFSSFDTGLIPWDETVSFFRKTAGFIENYYGFRFNTIDMLLDDILNLYKKNCRNTRGQDNSEARGNTLPEKS